MPNVLVVAAVGPDLMLLETGISYFLVPAAWIYALLLWAFSGLYLAVETKIQEVYRA